MTNTYTGGYKKALMDIWNLLDRDDIAKYIKYKQQYRWLIKDIIQYTLEHPEARESFHDGIAQFKIQDGKLVEII